MIKKELYLVNPIESGMVRKILSRIFKPKPSFYFVLKALTPEEYKIIFFNCVYMRPEYFKAGRLVGITCCTNNASLAYKYATKYRKAGSTVVMGGPHVSANQDEALKYCDSVVLGEAESVWKNVLADYEEGKLKKKYIGEFLDDFSASFHDYYLKADSFYLSNVIQTTRGCKNNCDFCLVPQLSDSRVRFVPVERIIEQIKAIKFPYNKLIVFKDDNIFSDPSYAKELFKALIPLRIKWISACCIDIAKDDEALCLAKKSGCLYLGLGLELTDWMNENKKYGKFINARNYIELLKSIRENGIFYKLNFIIGFDEDTYFSVFKSWWQCFKSSPLLLQMVVLTPLPGSPLYKRLLKEDRIRSFNWNKYNFSSVVYNPKNMSALGLYLYYRFVSVFFLLTCSLLGRVILFSFIISILLIIIS